MEEIDLTGRHYSVINLFKFFSFTHLPQGPLRDTSEMCHNLAVNMIEKLPDGNELTAGLRKLLEAKDCFVRQALELTDL